jgi:hypothetical protein
MPRGILRSGFPDKPTTSVDKDLSRNLPDPLQSRTGRCGLIVHGIETADFTIRQELLGWNA